MTTTTQAHYAGSSKVSEAPDLNTIPDPRAPSPMDGGNQSPSPSGPQHPDLSNEVAALSAKLINAINNLTNLDGALQDTRQELDEARVYISHLEKERDQHREAVASGILIRRTDIEKKEQRLERQMVEEQKKRNSAERQKKGMESELENLTGQLFEEANAMVAAARHEKQEAERRADMYRTKLEDTELLLASQQAQLQQLKDVMHEERKKPRDSMQSTNTAPATPVIGANEKLSSSTFNYPTHTRNALSAQSLPPPESPLHFNHLIHPVVRTDVQSYEDFVALLRTNKGSTPPRRSASGSYAGLNVLGLGSKELTTQSTVIPSIRSAINVSSRSASTPTPSGNNSPRIDDSDVAAVALKDTKYYKRALVEDIEPTLRLDTAPGLSWLARRGVLNSITSGRLIVEPYPSRHAFHSPAFACALCGEIRTSDEHIRRYRFRASDSDEAQRYSVCDYCLARLRSTCDFTSFLRMAKKGVMKNDTVDECRVAWEECIKLREKMFWSRVGGGVIPAPGSGPSSPIHAPYLGADKESITQASQSDSDLASISRADSHQTSSSEQPDVTPLSGVRRSDQTRSKETLPMNDVVASHSSTRVGERHDSYGTQRHSTDGSRPAVDTSMPPPRLPEPRATQSGAQDTDPIKHASSSTSRPSSSAASNRAFFEAKSHQAQHDQATTNLSNNQFKRPSIPASQSQPSSGDPLQPSPVESISNSPLSQPAQSFAPLRRGSNIFPRPSSSKSIKSFSFGPRDGRLASTVSNDSAVNDANDDGIAVLEHLAPRTTSSSIPTRASTPAEQSASTSAVSYLGALFTSKASRILDKQLPSQDVHENSVTQGGRDSEQIERRVSAAEDITNGVTQNALAKLAMGSELAAVGLPSGLPPTTQATSGSSYPRPRSLTNSTPAAASEPGLPARTRPTSMLPTTASLGLSSEPVIPNVATPPAQSSHLSPRPTPRTSVSESQPSANMSHTPRHSVADPVVDHVGPTTPAQTPKRANKVAALASRFGGEESLGNSPPARSIAGTPPLPLKRPSSSSSEAFKRPGSSGSGLKSSGASPERTAWPAERRKSVVENAMESLGSPERFGRMKDGNNASERAGSSGGSKSRGGSHSRGVSPIQIPGAFA